MNSTVRRVAVLGGARIPFARQNGPYAQASNQDMLTTALNAVVEKFGLEGERLDEVAAGAVLKHSRDFNLNRRGGPGLDARAGDSRLRRAAGLRARDGNSGRQQDRARADRVRDRGRGGHHLRCAMALNDGLRRERP